jgi:CRISPR-associated endonuclease/helicase Cas3
MAEQLRRSAFTGNESLIALSSLRGQKADNREWCLDPSRPAIIIGTVDMIGSRLLFSGYGKVGINHRSLQAGLLGQDSLIVIDEAHLSPSFVETLLKVRSHIQPYSEIRPFHVMSLSATISGETDTLKLDESVECLHPEAERRLNASKSLEWVRYNQLAQTNPESPQTAASNDKELVEKIVACAIRYENDNPDAAKGAIIIFASTVDLVNAITSELIEAIFRQIIATSGSIDRKTKDDIRSGIEKRVLKLTGEMRGLERDQLVETAKFKSFLPARERGLTGQTHYLVATSCAEVGVNIDADHGVCDLSTLDSMIQRIGRINRFGLRSSTVSVLINEAGLISAESDYNKDLEHQQKLARLEGEIVALEAEVASANSSKERQKELKGLLKGKKNELTSSKKKGPAYEFPKLERVNPKIFHTWKALLELAHPNGVIDVSPLSLRGLIDRHRKTIPEKPVLPPLEPARIDDWAMTSLKQSEYPRPLVHYWLRGVVDDERAETTFVWRDELCDGPSFAQEGPCGLGEIATMIPSYPRERATLSTIRAEKILREMARRSPDHFLVLIDPGGDALPLQLGKLNDKKEDVFSMIAFRTIILPSSIGGLDQDGNPDLRSASSSDVLDQQEWKRYFIKRNQEGQFLVRALGREEENRQFHSLGEVMKSLTDGGILINRKNLQDRFTSDEESPLSAIAFVRHPVRGKEEINEPENDESSLALPPRSVIEHDQDVERYARELCQRIGISPELTEIIAAAGYRHDTGKAREWWQKAVGNYENWRFNPVAKSNARSFDHSLNQGYRHEFGSLIESLDDQSLQVLSDPELVLHLIASHHGYARPHFPERAFDRNQPRPFNLQAGHETILRFDRLQKRYGWWQLAYLEAILKAADALASRDYSNGRIGGAQ